MVAWQPGQRIHNPSGTPRLRRGASSSSLRSDIKERKSKTVGIVDESERFGKPPATSGFLQPNVARQVGIDFFNLVEDSFDDGKGIDFVHSGTVSKQ